MKQHGLNLVLLLIVMWLRIPDSMHYKIKQYQTGVWGRRVSAPRGLKLR